LQDTELTVMIDGHRVYEGVLAAGQSRTFLARARIEVVAANGRTILLAVNGKDVGLPGDPGVVFRARYGPRGRRGGCDGRTPSQPASRPERRPHLWPAVLKFG